MKPASMQELSHQMRFGKAADITSTSDTSDSLFAAQVDRQSRFVFRVVRAALRNVQDAEDVVQEAFLKLYKSGAWTLMEDERAFLAKAAWRLAINQIRANRKSEPNLELTEPAYNPERAAIVADWNATVQRMIDGLPEELRLPLVLSATDEPTSREIAVVMGISEGTVRTRIMRARQILKQKLTALTERRHE
jgi:RNA polymerase sigma-70 factor (ECF subfamily)